MNRNKLALAHLFRQYGGIIIALIILCAIFSFANSRFLSFANFKNIFQQIAVVAILAFGMTWVILLGEIDLSVGSMLAVAGMVGAQIFIHDYGILAALGITLLAGALMGALNGWLTARLMLPSFIVTVATMSIYRGIVSLPTGGAPAAIMNQQWLAIGTAAFLGIPLIIWILLILFLFNHILLSSRLYSAQTNAGISYELDAIAAAVLGGTSLAGGVGTMIGTLIGALIIGVLNNGMNMLSVPYFYQLIVKGVVILVAVRLDIRAKQRRE